ncbi:MAG: hypothetical protein QNJ40_02650 [Xanthomonadales bacterium]|nr:hypothetical protein [Xanthomonadales bacterium]
MNSRSPSNPAGDGNVQPNRGRLTLLLLFGLFLAPIVVALFLNSRWSDWAPGATRNNGELVSPVLVLNEVSGLQNAFDRWTILSRQTGDCAQPCRDQLDELLRVRQTLGHDMDDVAVLLVSPDAPIDPLPDGLIWQADVNGGMARALSGRQLSDYPVFLVDPLGNLMMAYPVPLDATGLRKDLDRLVKYSKFNPMEGE